MPWGIPCVEPSGSAWGVVAGTRLAPRLLAPSPSMMDVPQATRSTVAWRRRRRSRLCAARWAFRHALFLKNSLHDTLIADMLKDFEALTASGFAVPPEVTDGETTPDNSTMNDFVVPAELGDPAAPQKGMASEAAGCENSASRSKSPQFSLKDCTEQSWLVGENCSPHSLHECAAKDNGSEAAGCENSSARIKTPQCFMKNCTEHPLQHKNDCCRHPPQKGMAKTMDLTPRVAKTLRSDESSAVFCENCTEHPPRHEKNLCLHPPQKGMAKDNGSEAAGCGNSPLGRKLCSIL